MNDTRNIIRDIIEEGKGSSSKKMRQRTAQKKHKERELRKMSFNELDDIASEYNLVVPESAHSSTSDDKDNLIQGILDEEK